MCCSATGSFLTAAALLPITELGLAFVAAQLAFLHAFSSVWCYFSAVLSLCRGMCFSRALATR